MRTAAAPAYGYATAYQSSPSNLLCFRKNGHSPRDQRPERTFRSARAHAPEAPCVEFIGASTDGPRIRIQIPPMSGK